MTRFAHFVASFIICYAIGYMLWVRPRYQSKKLDLAFYLSLVALSTLRYFV
jgi:hypothetical protein